MRLYIIRHGETRENLRKIMQGHLHGSLSEKGIEQAEKLAMFLKNEKFDYIYSSDLHRASETAKKIAFYHANTELLYTDKLREFYLGDLQGKIFDYKNLSDKEIKETFSNSGAETLEEIYKRATIFFEQIFIKHSDENIMIVGHNGINKAIIASITGEKPAEIPKMENLKNTSISIIEINNSENFKIIKYNSIEHL